jgi:hypothetical protein
MKMKIIRNFINAPWFTGNTQTNTRETNTHTIKGSNTTLTVNLHSRLTLATGALFYNIGRPLIQPRFKPRLSQDVLNL